MVEPCPEQTQPVEEGRIRLEEEEMLATLDVRREEGQGGVGADDGVSLGGVVGPTGIVESEHKVAILEVQGEIVQVEAPEGLEKSREETEGAVADPTPTPVAPTIDLSLISVPKVVVTGVEGQHDKESTPKATIQPAAATEE